MYSVLKKGFLFLVMAGEITGVSISADAKDTVRLPEAGIEEVLRQCDPFENELKIEKYLVPEEKGDYPNMAFADVDSFLYIREKPTRQSRWVGKLYPGDAAKIMGPVGKWTKVQSGEVNGYVCSKYIIIGREAENKARKIIKEKKKKKENTKKKTEELFAYAVSRTEEEREEKDPENNCMNDKVSENTSSGQAVVDYACQFIGNPYVWGGTSLTEGADCSGFVQSVYRHFGVNLPRTSGEQRTAGHAVSYDEAKVGDIICYDGHVGIYKGNGEIVNAINRSRGIGVLSATYTNIITVRRIF